MRSFSRFILAFLLVAFATAASADVIKIVIDGMISPITDEFIGRALVEARKQNASAVLIELRTPGGLVDSTRDIVNKILVSPVPIIVYVAPSGSRAASAGFFLLEAADIAAMAPGTNTGAAHPVSITGEKIDDVMKTKMENDTAAFMRAFVAKRGRNVAVAESAVRESKSFTEQEALQLKLIDIVASSQADLFKQISGRKFKRFDGREVQLQLTKPGIRVIEMTLKQQILAFIMDPNVAFILFALGALGIWAEFNHPGAILPGVVGLISILLAVFALNILPTRFAAVALIIAAFVLFVLEAKFASHGILGAGGVIAMFIGGLLLIDSPVPELRVHWITSLAVSLPFGVIVVFLMTLVLKSRHFKVSTGEQGMIGEIGVARTALTPNGKIFVHGELWNAVSSTPLDPGAQVKVREIEGLTLKVDPA